MTDPIEDLRVRNPDAADLAALCSLALHVEPRLLRLLRLLLPGADVSAETDLWSSPLVATASVGGLSLRPDVAHRLGAELLQPRWDPLREQAIALIDSAHARATWSARLSEQLARLAVSEAPASRARELVLAGLHQLSGSDATSREQVGIARWLLAALARLPANVLFGEAGEAAQAAGFAANLHLGTRATAAADPVVEQRWLPWLLTRGVETVDVALAFQDGRLEIHGDAGDTVLAVPRTDPLVLDLDWSDGTAPRSTRVTFPPYAGTAVQVDSDRVEIRTLAGTGVRLSAARTNADAGFDFGAQWARYRLCLAREPELSDTLGTLLAGNSVVISGTRGSGKTVLLCATAARLRERGSVVLAHFYGVEPAWDEPALVAASLDAQLRAVPLTERAAGPIFVLLDDVPADPSDFVDHVARLAPHFDRNGWLAVATYLSESASGHPPLPWPDIPADPGAERVCEAMLAAVADSLSTRLAADPAELIGMAGGNPGRLARLLDWVLAHDHVQLEGVPPTLTVGFGDVLNRVAVALPDTSETRPGVGPGWATRWLAVAAVAEPGLTAAELARTITPDGDDNLALFLDTAAAAGLLVVDGPARTRDGVWLSAPVRPAVGLGAALAGQVGPTVLADARFALAQAALVSGVAKDWSRYQINTVTAHVGAAEAAGWGEQLRSLRGSWPNADFLRRRAVQSGVAAAAADVEALGHWPDVAPVLDAARFVASALAPVPPDAYADLVVNELRRRGYGEGVVGRLLDGAWPPQLAVRAADPVPPEPLDGADALELDVVGNGVWIGDGAIRFADGRADEPWTPSRHGIARPTAVVAGAGFVAVAGTPAEAAPDAPPTRLALLSTASDRPAAAAIEPIGELRAEAPVSSVGFDTSGQRVAWGSVDGTSAVGTVDGSNGVVLAVRERVRSVAFGPGDSTVVTADEAGAFSVVDATTGEVSARPPQRSGPAPDLRAVAVAPFGSRVAVGTTTGELTLTDVANGRSQFVPVPRRGEIGAVAFSPTGRTLAVGVGRSAFTVDVEDPKPRAVVEFVGVVTAVALSGETGLLAVGGEGVGVQIHDLTSQQDGPAIADPGPVAALAFSPDGAILAAASGEALVLYDVPGGAELARVPHPGIVNAVRFALDGHRLVTGGEDGVVRVFELGGARADTSNRFDLPAAITSLDVVGDFIVAGSAGGVVTAVPARLATPYPVVEQRGDARATVDPDDYMLTTLVGHGAAVTAASATPEAAIATAALDGTVRVWDVVGRRSLAVLRHRAPVRHVVTTGEHLVSGDDQGQVCWWSDGFAFAPPFAHAAPVTVLVAFPDGSVVSCAADGSIVRSVVTDGQVTTAVWCESGSGVRLAVADGDLLVTSHDDRTLRWWSAGRPYGQRTLPRPARSLVTFANLSGVQAVHDGGTTWLVAPTGPGDDDPQALRALAVASTGTVAVGDRATAWTSERPGHGEWTEVGGQAPRSLAYTRVGLLAAWSDRTVTRGGRPYGTGDLVSAAGERTAVVSADQVRLVTLASEASEPVTPLLLPGEQPTAVLVPLDGDGLLLGTDHGRLVILDSHLRPRAASVLGPAPVTALADYVQGFAAGTADGGLYVLDALGTRLVARHGDRVDGVTTVGGSLLLSASADRTLRLWDADRGTERGRLAHTAGFTAVAAQPDGRAVARSADGLVWLVDLDGQGWEPVAADLFRAEALPQTGAVVDAGRLRLRLACRLVPEVPVELRRIVIDRPAALRLAAAPVISLDEDGRFAEPLRSDGRLESPRRVAARSALTVQAWLTFPQGVATDVGRSVATARFWVSTPTRPDLPYEITLTVRGENDLVTSEDDLMTSEASVSLGTVPGLDPITVTYRGLEEPFDVRARPEAGATA